MTQHYLSASDFAKRIGITQQTLATYFKDGRMPEPDVVIGSGHGARYGWLSETVDNWQSSRPGKVADHARNQSNNWFPYWFPSPKAEHNSR